MPRRDEPRGSGLGPWFGLAQTTAVKRSQARTRAQPRLKAQLTARQSHASHPAAKPRRKVSYELKNLKFV